MDDVLAKIQLWKIKFQVYANDLVIMITRKSENQISEILLQIIKTLFVRFEKKKKTNHKVRLFKIPLTKKKKFNRFINEKCRKLSMSVIPNVVKLRLMMRNN